MKPGLLSIVLSVIILILVFIIGMQEGRIRDAEHRAFKAETRIVQLERTVKWVSVLEQILPENDGHPAFFTPWRYFAVVIDLYH